MAAGRADTKAPWLRRLTVRHLLFMAPWVGLVIIAMRPLRDNSFLWHVRAGALQIEAGEVLRVDPFSFTFQGEPWRTQSWVAELGYGALNKAFGLNFVPWLVLITAVLTLGLVALVSYRRTRSAAAVVAGLVAATWLGFGYLSPRPVLLSYLLLALVLLLLDTPRGRWALPVTIWLWAAIHGSFLLGIGLIALEGVRTRDRRRAFDVAVGVAVASLTAHGLAVWEILVDFVRNRGALSLITEWAPPDLLTPGQLPYLLAVAGLTIAAAQGRISARDLWVPLPFLLFGLTSARALFPSFLVVLPWALLALPELATSRARAIALPRAIAHWGLAVAIVVLPLLLVDFPGLSTERFPLEAAEHVGAGPLFHDDVTGGYLIFRGEPPVYVDDRAELYGEEFLEEFISIRSARPGWEDALNRAGIVQALVRTSDSIAEALPAAGWTEVFRDVEFVLFRKA